MAETHTHPSRSAGPREASRKGGQAGRGPHLLFKTPRSQLEREKDLTSSYRGLLPPLENDFRKEKAGLEGSTEESQIHAQRGKPGFMSRCERISSHCLGRGHAARASGAWPADRTHDSLKMTVGSEGIN